MRSNTENRLVILRKGAIGLVTSVGTFLVSSAAFAGTTMGEAINQGSKDVAGAAGYTTTATVSLQSTVGKLIFQVMGLLGIVVVCFFIYAGFLWMTAQGDAKQTQKAKDIMMTTVIGLVILLSAYAITDFVLKAVITGTSGA